MCCIMSYFGSKLTKEEFTSLIRKVIYRGPDSERIIETPNGLLGFERLAIMGLDERGMQPFSLNGRHVVCNGEIYGFEKIKEELQDEYEFESASDCEVLLPLYERYGVEMFKRLDAEFALVITDDETGDVIAARDPFGIRPLFYGYDSYGSIAFSSEAISLMGLCDKILPFPPGHYYFNGNFTCYNDIGHVNKVIYDDVETASKKIHDKLVAGVEKRLRSDAKIGFLLSGGLDSSLVCAIASRRSNEKIRTFAIGMSEDAIDLKYARKVATYIDSIHTEVIITKEDVLKSLETVIKHLASYDITTIRASIGMYLVCKYIHDYTDIKVLLTGEISDELFGYKYTDFAPTKEELQKEAEKRVRELYMYDVLRADRCISACSMEARVPFGDLDFAKYVMALDPGIKMNIYNKGKYLLRKAFEDNYLPEEILYREKAAFSDAVGHSLVNYLKEYAESLYSDEELEKQASKIEGIKPFTKESLLYRQIFDKYYPGQSGMIKGYWMPNSSWPGCNVNDPSARVLSNYGDSGV